MYPLQQDLLRSVGQERFNPVEIVFPNAIAIEFVKETIVKHLVQRLAEIEQNDVYLVSIWLAILWTVTTSWDSQERVLTVAEYLVLDEMLQGGTVDNIVQYLARDGRE